jgi:hypothetical protein
MSWASSFVSVGVREDPVAKLCIVDVAIRGVSARRPPRPEYGRETRMGNGGGGGGANVV